VLKARLSIETGSAARYLLVVLSMKDYSDMIMRHLFAFFFALTIVGTLDVVVSALAR